MLQAEVMETLLCGCVTWTLGPENIAELRTVPCQVPTRTSSYWLPARTTFTDHTTVSYPKALKNHEDAVREHRNDHQQTTALVRGGRGAAKRGATTRTQSGDVLDDNRWGGPRRRADYRRLVAKA